MKLLLSFFITLITFFCFSQEEAKEDLLVNTKRNTLYLELGGSGALYSVNYDRILKNKKRGMTSFSIGTTYWGKIDYSDGRTDIGIPVSYNYLIGKKNNHLELGIGLTILYSRVLNNYLDAKEDQKGISSIFSLKCGYRYQKPTGGFLFRATFTPILYAFSYNKTITTYTNNDARIIEYSTENQGFLPWAGISIGYT